MIWNKGVYGQNLDRMKNYLRRENKLHINTIYMNIYYQNTSVNKSNISKTLFTMQYAQTNCRLNLGFQKMT